MHTEPPGSRSVEYEPLRSFGWAASTAGVLSRRERLHLWPAVLRGYLEFTLGALSAPFRAALRSPAHEPLARPDSRLARLAEEAALEQPPELVGHGYRAWLFGGILACREGAVIDPELFYVASLLHDTGLASAVAGEDFTLRSARVAMDVCTRAELDTALSGRLADALVAHATPGLRPAEDPLAYYVQAGALADLTGLRAWHIGRRAMRDAYARYPARDAHTLIAALIRREAEALPEGRFALLVDAALPAFVQYSPMRACEGAAVHAGEEA